MAHHLESTKQYHVKVRSAHLCSMRIKYVAVYGPVAILAALGGGLQSSKIFRLGHMQDHFSGGCAEK